MAKIEIIDASPQLKPDGSLAVDIKAALVKERQEGSQGESTRIPHISFRIKSALLSVTAISGSNGIMIINNFSLGKAFEDKPPESLDIMAVYTNHEDVSEVVIKGTVEIGHKLRVLLGRRASDRGGKLKADSSIEIGEKLKAMLVSIETIFAEESYRTTAEKSNLSGTLDKLESIIRNASATSADIAEHLARFSHPYGTEKIMLCLANMRPRFIINNLEQYQNQPWAKKVYLSVAIKPNLDHLLDRAEEQSLLKKKITEIGEMLYEMQDCPENYAKKEELVKCLMRHKFHPQIKVVFSTLARRNPEVFLEYIDYYKHEPWAFETLSEIPISHALLYKCFHKYSDKPWAKEVVLGLADANQVNVVLYLLGEFAKLNWAKDIMKIIALKHPDVIFSEIKYIESYPWAEEVVKVAATQDPEIAFKRIAQYNKQPWVTRVLDAALQAKAAAVEKNRHTIKQ